jgi:hypothetical protein
VRVALLLALAVALPLCGALGDPFLPDEVPFVEVERQHFDAVGVVLERAEDNDAPLVVRLNVVGDGADADLERAFAWLREHAGIEVVRAADGAPLFLTYGDLAATSGRGTLGATVPEGMAAEVRDMRIGSCVVAHEILHFVGLKHVKDRHNIMYPHCSRDFLDRATLEEWQRDHLSTLDVIRATTPGGVKTWAQRG